MDEEEDKGDTYGVGPSCTRLIEELGNLKQWKDNLEQTLEQEKSIM
jgi:hypothetical protein